MMPLPQRFDQNEWFLLICNLLAYFIILLLPRRFPFSITILLLLFGTVAARLSDVLIASPGFDLYNVMDTPKYDFFDLVTYISYAPFAYLFVYYYDKWKVKGYWVIPFLLLCTTGGTLYEWVNKVFHVFTYKGWQLSYSFNYYFATQCVTLLFYHWIKRHWMGQK